MITRGDYVIMNQIESDKIYDMIQGYKDPKVPCARVPYNLREWVLGQYYYPDSEGYKTSIKARKNSTIIKWGD